MFVLGLILLLLGLLVYPSHILVIIGAILLVLGLCGNGYAHFGTPAGDRRRYWY